MKIVIWAYPARAIDIKLINSFEQPIDDVPIDEASAWMDTLIPTIQDMIQLRDVDEALVIGPTTFAKHIANKIETQIPNLIVHLGDYND